MFDHVATYSGTFKRHEVDDMVYEYNQNLEPDEDIMIIVEMIEILREKGVIHATDLRYSGR